MGLYLLRGILIGLLFGLPAGAVGAMTVQRTLAHGPRVGILTGMGSSAADCLYACVGAFGLTFLSDFLLQHQTAINVLGGVLILSLGGCLLLRKNADIGAEPGGRGIAKMFAASFAIGITNPATILTFLFAFSYFGINGQLELSSAIALVLGVFIGTSLWWTILAGTVGILKNKFGTRQFKHINRIFGIVLILFGAVVLLRTFLNG